MTIQNRACTFVGHVLNFYGLHILCGRVFGRQLGTFHLRDVWRPRWTELLRVIANGLLECIVLLRKGGGSNEKCISTKMVAWNHNALRATNWKPQTTETLENDVKNQRVVHAGKTDSEAVVRPAVVVGAPSGRTEQE